METPPHCTQESPRHPVPSLGLSFPLVCEGCDFKSPCYVSALLVFHHAWCDCCLGREAPSSCWPISARLPNPSSSLPPLSSAPFTMAFQLFAPKSLGTLSPYSQVTGLVWGGPFYTWVPFGRPSRPPVSLLPPSTPGCP